MSFAPESHPCLQGLQTPLLGPQAQLQGRLPSSACQCQAHITADHRQISLIYTLWGCLGRCTVFIHGKGLRVQAIHKKSPAKAGALGAFLCTLFKLGVHQFKALLHCRERPMHEGHQHPEKVFPVHKLDLPWAHLLNLEVVLPCEEARQEQPALPAQLLAGGNCTARQQKGYCQI